MKKPFLQPNCQEKLLIFIGHCLPDIKYHFSYQKIQQIFKKYYQVKYSVSNLRKELSSLKTTKLITYTKHYHKEVPILTREGKLKIIPRLPYRKFDPWDGKWRVIIFSIPEKERVYRIIFQKKLKELNFQKIQEGIYMSPHPYFSAINRLSNQLGIRQYLTLIEATKIDREKRTIQKIWKLDAINQEYKNFIEEAKKIQQKKFWPIKAKLLEQKFYQIYQQDPHLPDQFLISNWQAQKAYELYRKIATSY